MSLNIELLKQVRDKIATTPEAYDQSVWGRQNSAAPCGTAACIAGWTCALGGRVSPEELAKARTGNIPGGYVPQDARKLLRLNYDELAVLFNPNPSEEDDDGSYFPWPEPYATAWDLASGDGAEEAKVAVAYLNHIIETGKVLE